MQQNNNTYQFYGPEDIQRYLSGSMSAQQMHDMEKAALKDPLLADAIDGFKNANPQITEKHLNDIRAAILGAEQNPATIVDITSTRKNLWWRWAVAACTLGILATAAWWLTKIDNTLAPVASLTQEKITDSSQVFNTKETEKKIDKPDALAVDKVIMNLPRPKSAEKPIKAIKGIPTATLPEIKTKAAELKPEIELNEIKEKDNSIATAFQERPSAVQMAKTEDSKDEIVMVNYRSNKKNTLNGAVADYKKIRKQTESAWKNEIIYPEEGWANFYQELGTGLGVDESKATKTMQIKFTVDDNGDPVDFEIIENPDEALTRKAIEMIKKSKWKNYKLDNKALVKIEVN